MTHSFRNADGHGIRNPHPCILETLYVTVLIYLVQNEHAGLPDNLDKGAARSPHQPPTMAFITAPPPTVALQTTTTTTTTNTRTLRYLNTRNGCRTTTAQAIASPLSSSSSSSFVQHGVRLARRSRCTDLLPRAPCPIVDNGSFAAPRMDLAGAGIYDAATEPSDVRVVIFGATGYIGRYVAREFIDRGYDVVIFSRIRSGVSGKKTEADLRQNFPGALLLFGDVTNESDVATAFSAVAQHEDYSTQPTKAAKTTIVVSCLASRTGGIVDSNRIDYDATLSTLRKGREICNISHFILLSAICVQKPELEFQRAKLRFEAELQREAEVDSSFSYSIVRPTAFFKSLAGQVDRMKKGAAFIMFGDGELCRCNALSERDLAAFIADCAAKPDTRNQILPVGGPGEPVSPKEQALMLFDILGKKPKFISLPIGLMDVAIGLLNGVAKVIPVAALKDAAEFGRIGKYYAVEDMVGPEYGQDTLKQFFEKAIEEGGLEGQELGDAAVF